MASNNTEIIDSLEQNEREENIKLYLKTGLSISQLDAFGVPKDILAEVSRRQKPSSAPELEKKISKDNGFSPEMMKLLKSMAAEEDVEEEPPAHINEKIQEDIQDAIWLKMHPRTMQERGLYATWVLNFLQKQAENKKNNKAPEKNKEPASSENAKEKERAREKEKEKDREKLQEANKKTHESAQLAADFQQKQGDVKVKHELGAQTTKKMNLEKESNLQSAASSGSGSDEPKSKTEKFNQQDEAGEKETLLFSVRVLKKDASELTKPPLLQLTFGDTKVILKLKPDEPGAPTVLNPIVPLKQNGQASPSKSEEGKQQKQKQKQKPKS